MIQHVHGFYRFWFQQKKKKEKKKYVHMNWFYPKKRLLQNIGESFISNRTIDLVVACLLDWLDSKSNQAVK